MFSRLTFSQRLQTGLIMGMALVLILGANRLNQRYYSEVNSAVNSVYKDRVIVQGYIFELNNIFHEKEVQFLHEEIVNSTDSTRIAMLLNDFGNTELTEKESRLLKDLNKQIHDLNQIENSVELSQNLLNKDTHIKYYEVLNNIEQTLVGLADVQLDQSSRLNIFSRDLLGMINLLSNIEIAFMILISIIILALIFYPFKS